MQNTLTIEAGIFYQFSLYENKQFNIPFSNQAPIQIHKSQFAKIQLFNYFNQSQSTKQVQSQQPIQQCKQSKYQIIIWTIVDPDKANIKLSNTKRMKFRSSVRFNQPFERKRRAITNFRDYQTDPDSNSNRYKTTPKYSVSQLQIPQNTSFRTIQKKKQHTTSLLSMRSLQLLEQDLDKLKKDVIRIQSQYEQFKIAQSSYLKPKNKVKIIPIRQENQGELSYNYCNKLYPPIASNKYNWMSNKKKKGRSIFLKPVNVDEDSDNQSQKSKFAVLESIKQKQHKRRNQSADTSSYLSVLTGKPKNKLSSRILKSLARFRKVTNAILFTIYLKTFNQRMRLQRKTLFNQYIKQNLKEKLKQLKHYLIQFSKPFFSKIIDNYNFDYRPLPSDGPTLRLQKISSLRKLVGLEVQCIHNCMRSMSNRQNLSQLLYYLCKHGTYSCQYQINCAQQMNLMCISQIHGYMRGDQFLQKSSILSLVFIKLLLYNILLQPETANFQLNAQVSKAIICNNIKLVGNILYELFIQVQDDLLQKSPKIYQIGNWGQLQHRFNFKLAEPMTVNNSTAKSGELISGLADHKLIKHTYGIKAMTDFKGQIMESLQALHQNIQKQHQKVRKKCFGR